MANNRDGGAVEKVCGTGFPACETPLTDTIGYRNNGDGDLIDAGRYQYIYDAWNRLIKIPVKDDTITGARESNYASGSANAVWSVDSSPCTMPINSSSAPAPTIACATLPSVSMM